ncbi:Membrane protein involved in the export of O-antigen and teichoic acid [Sphingomonas guangdongensis]|uniref:Membrane protein involved in the export of O-antigen and teichoic acid n=1 Tax=Sphingomonas guangdongensis TaxID=1141890 RepID=A0A285R3T6_9SPHN|nr:oligosaccharide flippase family protein [Sphingomonas guangdongensis]SOB87017.1 Membrane protein involved in the export of O-antigen and teichoic acid [Sphingomonas guangdongensis]
MTTRADRTDSRAGGLRAALRNLGWLLASRGMLAVLSLLYLGIATRTLGLADFGRFALVTGAVQGLALLISFQTWQVVVRYGVDHRARGDDRALARLFRACLILDGAGALIGIAAGAAFLLWWGDALGIGAALRRDAMILTVAQLGSVRSAAVGVLRLQDRFGQAAAADLVTPVVRLAGAIAAAAALPTLGAFLWSWAAAEVATAGAYWWALARSGELGRVRRVRAERGTVARENPGIGPFLVTSNLASTLVLGTKQVPLLLVGGFAGPAAAGAFRLALQLAQALGKLAQLISRAAFPEVVRALRDASPEELGVLSRRMLRAGGLAAIVILCVVAAVGRPALVLVGGDESYAAGFPLLLWLAAAGSIDLAVVGLEPVLLAAGRSGAALASRAAGVAVQVGVSLYLLPRIGASGASVGVFAASLLGALLMIRAVFRAPAQR